MNMQIYIKSERKYHHYLLFLPFIHQAERFWNFYEQKEDYIT
jgi:hypothetical protein